MELFADKHTASSSTSNGLADENMKDDKAIDRPKKKRGRKRFKNRQKKLQQTSDDYFCGTPSKCQLKIIKNYLIDDGHFQKILFIFWFDKKLIRPWICAYGFVEIGW